MVKFFVLASLILSASSFAYGQNVPQKIFAPLPSNIRAQLINRLKLLTKYQRDENGAQMYDMLFGFIPRKFSRREYIQAMRGCHHRAFLDFTPRSLDKSFNDDFRAADWRISGTAKVRYADGVKEREAFVFAKIFNGRWYFSGIIIPEPELGID